MDAPSDAAVGARGIAPPLFFFLALLNGAATGFVTVTMGFVLTHHGFSVAAVAGLVSLAMLPATWRVIFGPGLDLSLDARTWFGLCAVLAAACVILLGLTPLEPARWPLFAVLVLALSAAANCSVVAGSAITAATTPQADRGRVAGWSQAGNLGGAGLGGGLGLWIATHAGFLAAGVVLAACFLLASWPLLLLRTPRQGAGAPMGEVVRDLWGEVSRLALTRDGAMAILAVTLPMGLGSFISLLPSVAGAWGASADLTAAATGLMAGLASVPGALAGGYACARYSPRGVLAASGVACAVGELAMAFGPRTAGAFVGFILINNLLLGFAYAAVAAVILVTLRRTGGGTVAALLGSLCNVPVLAVTLLLGAAQTRHGVEGMMLIEAGLGAASGFTYGLLAWLWRPATRPALAA